MDGMYGGYHPTAAEYSDKALLSPEPYPILPSEYANGGYLMMPAVVSATDRSFPIFGSDDLLSAAASSTPPPHHAPPRHQGEDNSDHCNYYYSYSDYNHNNNNNNYNNPRDDDVSGSIKARIASHPRYPRLLDAYIDCQKVGAPPEMASLLDEIRREEELYKRDAAVLSTCYGPDPELDEFMETYCDVLVKYKSDLEKPFDEASRFLSKVEVQLRNLCIGASIRTPSDEGAVSSDEELSGGELDIHENQPSVEDRDLKDRLLRRFGSHISSLKLEFSKKKKKGKLPKEARQELLEWWNVHYKWPYPTEADKIQLAESTGLDQKQINNWFINQRKRHWKPSENMQFAVMNNSLSGQFFTDDD